MAGEWISGKEVMEKRSVQPTEIGEACHKGLLCAYKTAHDDFRIYDLGTVERVPKYPPKGINQLDHIKSGENVSWDWEEILGIKSLRKRALELRCVMRDAYPVWKAKDDRPLLGQGRHDLLGTSWRHEYGEGGLRFIPDDDKPEQHNKGGIHFISKQYNPYADFSFDVLTLLLNNSSEECSRIEVEIFQKTYPDFSASIAAQEECRHLPIPQDEKYNFSCKFAWDTLIPKRYCCLIDGVVVKESDIQGGLFYFDFAMFKRDFDKIHGGQPPFNNVVAEYTQKIEAMVFRHAEINKLWYETSPAKKPQDYTALNLNQFYEKFTCGTETPNDIFKACSHRARFFKLLLAGIGLGEVKSFGGKIEDIEKYIKHATYIQQFAGAKYTDELESGLKFLSSV